MPSHPTAARRLPRNVDVTFAASIQTRPFDKNGWEDSSFVGGTDHAQPSSLPEPGDDDRYATHWRPHEPHIGRRPPDKGAATFRGATVDASGKELVVESTYEMATATILSGDSRVAKVECQVGPVHHVDGEGKVRRPVFDFRSTDGAGEQELIAVKPRRRRAPSKIDETVAAVVAQRPDLAGRVTVWTEDQLARSTEHNAGLILRSRRLRNSADVAEMSAHVQELKGVVSIGQLIGRARSPPARAFAAIVVLIDERRLIPAESGRIRPELRVQAAQ